MFSPETGNDLEFARFFGLSPLGDDEFLVAGSEVRIGFDQTIPNGRDVYRIVEEGTFKDGRWVKKRRWNGDQVDHGINLTKPALLKVRFGALR